MCHLGIGALRETSPANPGPGGVPASSGSSAAAFFRFLGDFCTPQKSYKKRLPKNMPQNLKNRTPDHPNVDFGITFGVHLGIDFNEVPDFVIICVNHWNAFV